MKMRRMKTLALAGAVGFFAAARAAESRAAATAAAADVVKVVGYLVKIDAAPDWTSAVATLVVKGKGRIAILVTDELTMKKFKVKKIRTDDEIKCSYREADGKNLSVSFLRAAGC